MIYLLADDGVLHPLQPGGDAGRHQGLRLPASCPVPDGDRGDSVLATQLCQLPPCRGGVLGGLGALEVGAEDSRVQHSSGGGQDGHLEQIKVKYRLSLWHKGAYNRFFPCMHGCHP